MVVEKLSTNYKQVGFENGWAFDLCDGGMLQNPKKRTKGSRISGKLGAYERD